MLDIVHYDLSPFQSPLGSKIRHTVLPFEKRIRFWCQAFLEVVLFWCKVANGAIWSFFCHEWFILISQLLSWRCIDFPNQSLIIVNIVTEVKGVLLVIDSPSRYIYTQTWWQCFKKKPDVVPFIFFNISRVKKKIVLIRCFRISRLKAFLNVVTQTQFFIS